MDARIAPLRTLTLGLAASALLAGTLPASPQETPAPAGAGGTVYNIEIIVFRAAGALGGAETWSAEAGARSIIIAGDDSTSGS
ncbi:MAG TPA: hypothetical protein VN869_02405, partial [Steroidobacteraceae bacterium]|nr:hypothetical protein [Steroidobacteraceae bacterium]